jgi:glutamate formiminotransferase
MAVIECVPNISEGRRPDVIDACADAVRQAGAALLNVKPDATHHRTVFTFAGTAANVRAAALALFAAALPRMDLRDHHGVHPRVGAVDVVPFVPLSGATMADCVDLARDVAAEIAARHALPVFLYEEAASSPGRRRLELIRRGQFEGLRDKLVSPGWAPDFGPATPHPTAGATVVGARALLIAFNVNLATDRLDVARRIARAVRESSGGLRFVKAMGVAIPDRGIVQVSMNLTRFRETSIYQVMARITTEAERDGVAVLESEVIGLIPQAALAEGAVADLQLDAAFGDHLILEHQLRGAGLAR